MRGYLCYAGMELKRALKRLPHILAGAAVLVVLMGAAALLAGKLLYGGQTVERIPVGVVLPEEDALAGQGHADGQLSGKCKKPLRFYLY